MKKQERNENENTTPKRGHNPVNIFLCMLCCILSFIVVYLALTQVIDEPSSETASDSTTPVADNILPAFNADEMLFTKYTPTPVPTSTPSPTPTPAPTFTLPPTATPECTATPVPTATNAPTAVPKSTPVPTVKPTPTPTNRPTSTPTSKPTATPTNKPTATPILFTPTPTIATYFTLYPEVMFYVKQGEAKSITALTDARYDTLVWTSSNTKVAVVDDNGIVTGLTTGTATISVTAYMGFGTRAIKLHSASVDITVDYGDYKFEENEYSLIAGESVDIPVSNAPRTDFTVTGGTSYKLTKAEDGSSVRFYSSTPGTYVITAKFYDDPDNTASYNCQDICTVSVNKYGFASTAFYTAAKKTVDMSCHHYSNEDVLYYTSSEPSVAEISDDGTVSALSNGSSTITAVVIDKDGNEKTYTSTLYVSALKITSSLKVSVAQTKNISISGLYKGASVSYSTENEAIATVTQAGKVSGLSAGTTKINVYVDGTCYKVNVEVMTPTSNDAYKVMVVGQSYEFTHSAIKTGSAYTYKIADTSIADFDSSGKLKAKKIGSTTMTLTADGTTYLVSLAVANVQAYQAITYAITNMPGAVYSQDKRMSDGYYDCSSLAWRSYSPSGIKFGIANYAPTAAGIGEYLTNHGQRIITGGTSDFSKLQPGDLIFYGGAANGRYLGIYHVAMYIGETTGATDLYSVKGSGSKYGLLIEATSRVNGITISGNSSFTKDVVMIGRPTK